MTREIFLDAVLREVRFSLDHDEIRAELTAHLEDEGEYLAARDGLTTSEAEAAYGRCQDTRQGIEQGA